MDVVFAAMITARELGALARHVANRRHETRSDTDGDANVLPSVALGSLSFLIASFSLCRSVDSITGENS